MSTNTDVNQVGNGKEEGSTLGVAGGLVSVYGETPVAQASAITAPATTAIVTASSDGYGFSTSSQGDAVVTAVRSIVTALKNFGITA